MGTSLLQSVKIVQNNSAALAKQTGKTVSSIQNQTLVQPKGGTIIVGGSNSSINNVAAIPTYQENTTKNINNGQQRYYGFANGNNE